MHAIEHPGDQLALEPGRHVTPPGTARRTGQPGPPVADLLHNIPDVLARRMIVDQRGAAAEPLHGAELASILLTQLLVLPQNLLKHRRTPVDDPLPLVCGQRPPRRRVADLIDIVTQPRLGRAPLLPIVGRHPTDRQPHASRPEQDARQAVVIAAGPGAIQRRPVRPIGHQATPVRNRGERCLPVALIPTRVIRLLFNHAHQLCDSHASLSFRVAHASERTTRNPTRGERHAAWISSHVPDRALSAPCWDHARQTRPCDGSVG